MHNHVQQKLNFIKEAKENKTELKAHFNLSSLRVSTVGLKQIKKETEERPHCG